ncbi:MAG: SprB repeat-containing protein, partial [Bacteroidales bacterium]|nr:SprB repeat-containing protein [Bacteroidales bacterium]
MKPLVFAVILSMTCLILHSQNYMWIKEIKGSGQVNPVEILQDNNGNYYVYGNFNGEIKFENQTYNAVALQDIFIAKYSAQGSLLWVKFITGSGTESAYGLKLNLEKNAIYISGVFNSNPINIMGTNIWNNGGNDIFLAKIDLNGNVIWAKNVVYGSSHQMGGYFDIDANGDIVMSGQFISSVTFFGDEGTMTIEPEDPIQRQNFIVKFNSDGNWLWSRLIYSTSDLSYVRNVNIYGNEYYLSGQVSGTVKYGNTTIASVSTSYRSGIVLKLNANGDLAWSRKIVPNSSDFYAIKHVSDVSGNQYIAGRFSSRRIRFDSTATDTSKKLYLNVATGTSDLYLVKYNRNGQFQWAKLYGGNKEESIINLISRNNQLIMTGSHGSKISFGTYTTEFRAQIDAFAVVLDINGNTINGLSATGKLNETGTGAFFSSTNRNYMWIGEYFSDTLRMNTQVLINEMATKRDGYIARFGCFDSIGFEMTKVTCPNASNGSLKAIPSFGNEPYTYLWSNGATTQQISNLPVGNYTVTVTGTNGCTLSRTLSVTLQPLLQASIINVQHINCFGGSTGAATANPINGTAPYTYQWSNNKTTQTITNLSAGTYTVTIRDACGSSATATVTITQAAKVDATVTNTPVTCRGGADGTATANPIGGMPPYSYQWSNGQTTQTVVGLIANTTYRVTVKDGCNNTVVKTTVLTQPQALSASVVTYASSPCQPTGTAVATASDGTPPYT